MAKYSEVSVPKPSGWALEYGKEQDWNTPFPHDWKDNLDQPKFTRTGTFAGKCTNYEAVHQIELRRSVNGSGSSSFGGAKTWPTVEACIAFNENEECLASIFAYDLADFVNIWLADRGR